MDTLTTNAVHMPRNANPEDYEYVEAFDNQPPPGCYIGEHGVFDMPDGTQQEGTNWMNAHDRWLRGMLYSSPTSRWAREGDDRSGQCDHCGAHIRYVAVLRHTPTGDHIAVGETCLDSRFSLSKADFDRLRKASAEERALHKTREAVEMFLLDASPIITAVFSTPEQFARIYNVADDTPVFPFDDGVLTVGDLVAVRSNHIVADMRKRLYQYGSLSDKQVAFAERLAHDPIRDRIRATKKALENWVPAPTGQTRVTGEVLSTKWVDSDFGGGLKMLVKAETQSGGNFKVWVTVPSALRGKVENGTRVQFTCIITQAKDDPTFSFGKRPSQAKVL